MRGLAWLGLGGAVAAVAVVGYYVHQQGKGGVPSTLLTLGPLPCPPGLARSSPSAPCVNPNEGDVTPQWQGACDGASRGITEAAALSTLKMTASAAAKAVGYPVGSPMYCVLVKQAALTVKVKRVTAAAAITQAKQDLAPMRKQYDAAMKVPAPTMNGFGMEASMFGADRMGRGAMMTRAPRSMQPTTAQVVSAVVGAPAPVDASQTRPIAPAPDPSARPRPIGSARGMRREPAGVSIFGGRVYEQDAIAAQSIMPREVPGVVTDMPAPIGPPAPVQGMMPTPVGAGAGAGMSQRSVPAWQEQAWRSIFGNRIDNQHLPPWDPNCPPAQVAAAVASPPAPDAVLPPAAAAEVKARLQRTHPSQRAAAWRSIFGNLILGRRQAATGTPPPPAVVAAVQTAVVAPERVAAAAPAMSGWHGHYYPPAAMSGWHGHYFQQPPAFRGFGGLIGFGGG